VADSSGNSNTGDIVGGITTGQPGLFRSNARSKLVAILRSRAVTKDPPSSVFAPFRKC
jgi:hypothetical protein